MVTGNNIFLNYKLTKLAEAILKNKIFLESNIIFKVLKEENENDWRSNMGAAYARRQNFLNNKPEIPVAQAVQMPQAFPDDVKGLTEMLKKVVKALTLKHNLSDKDIEKLVVQTIHDINHAGLSNFTVSGNHPMNVGGSFDTGRPDPIGFQSPEYGESPKKPDFYYHMNDNEKEWFDNLDKGDKAQFAFRYDTLRKDSDGKSYKLGEMPIDPGSDEGKEVQKIFDKIKNNGKSEKVNWEMACGLYNRNKIRQNMKDHYKDIGQTIPDLKEWCFLAGVR